MYKQCQVTNCQNFVYMLIKNSTTRFQDAMAIVRELGKPDLFITFTAHGKWDHNIRSLHEGEDTEDRPDVTNRIFKQKLERLRKDIMDENFFGRAKALVYTIEFQKRG